eukprot:9495914-Pyramimonas_sp.AAC.1
MLLDNASSHTLPALAKEWAYKDLRGFEMSHTIFAFLPKNTTSEVQPLDQGIISATKARYRGRHVRWYIAEVEADPPNPKAKVDLRLAICWVVESFREVVEETIRNCWAHSRILPSEAMLELRQQQTAGSKTHRKNKLESLGQADSK